MMKWEHEKGRRGRSGKIGGCTYCRLDFWDDEEEFEDGEGVARDMLFRGKGDGGGLKERRDGGEGVGVLTGSSQGKARGLGCSLGLGKNRCLLPACLPGKHRTQGAYCHTLGGRRRSEVAVLSRSPASRPAGVSTRVPIPFPALSAFASTISTSQ